MLGLALVAAFLGQPEPPRTVNDQVLGQTEDFATAGPARVCIGRTSIDIVAGETAYLDYLGIHWGIVRVEGPHGIYRIRVGGWQPPEASFRIIRQTPDLEIERHPLRGRSRYLFWGRVDGEPRTRAIAWLEGDALNGSTRDLGILHRIDVNLSDPQSCRRRFNYGWGVVMGEEPPETRE